MHQVQTVLNNNTTIKYMYKYFPIVYSTKNPEKSIFVSPDDFDLWEMQFPDSLNWVRDKLEF
jgi:hypothetical protein